MTPAEELMTAAERLRAGKVGGQWLKDAVADLLVAEANERLKWEDVIAEYGMDAIDAAALAVARIVNGQR